MRQLEIPKLYIMTGLPFSGKTTLSRELVRLTGAAHINIDEVGKTLNLPTIGRILKPKEIQLLLREHNKRTIDALREGQSAIHDTVNPTRERRREIVALGVPFGAEPTIIYARAPFDKTVERRDRSRQIGDRQTPDDTLMINIYNRYEPPTDEEPHVVYDSTTTTAEAFAQALVDSLR